MQEKMILYGPFQNSKMIPKKTALLRRSNSKKLKKKNDFGSPKMKKQAHHIRRKHVVLGIVPCIDGILTMVVYRFVTQHSGGKPPCFHISKSSSNRFSSITRQRVPTGIPAKKCKHLKLPRFLVYCFYLSYRFLQFGSL